MMKKRVQNILTFSWMRNAYCSGISPTRPPFITSVSVPKYVNGCHYSTGEIPNFNKKSAKDFLKELQVRNIIFQKTEGVENCLNGEIQNFSSWKRPAIYAGFDPTSDGLHLGNLFVLQTLKRFQQAGFPIVALVGGATGLIGDPSGRKSERPLLTLDTVQYNTNSIKNEIHQFLGSENVKVLNNADWFSQITFIDLLRDVGKYFSMGNLLRLESIRSRLEHEEGMSFTEFSYVLMQSYDFHYLHKHYGVTVQIGGSDQWGNITMGLDLIKKKKSASTVTPQTTVSSPSSTLIHEEGSIESNSILCGGITIPLLTTSDGKKFGKSEGNAIFLNPQKTSPYDFYQYFIRTDDSDVIKLLRTLTFLPIEEIQAIEREHAEKPDMRKAQQILANEMTRMVHGEEELDKVAKASQLLFKKDIDFSSMSRRDIETLLKDAPSKSMKKEHVIGKPLPRLLKDCGLCASSTKARTTISGGGLYINSRRETNPNYILSADDILPDQIIVFRIGKKEYFIVHMIE